jgi:hypothetical protein
MTIRIKNKKGQAKDPRDKKQVLQQPAVPPNRAPATHDGGAIHPGSFTVGRGGVCHCPISANCSSRNPIPIWSGLSGETNQGTPLKKATIFEQWTPFLGDISPAPGVNLLLIPGVSLPPLFPLGVKAGLGRLVLSLVLLNKVGLLTFP